MKTSRLLLLSTSLLLVAACGTKGPLVLPGKETPARTVEPVELPDDADDDRRPRADRARRRGGAAGAAGRRLIAAG